MKILHVYLQALYREKFESNSESLFGLSDTCYICWPDAPLKFFFLYLHGFILYTLRGFLKRCEITPATSALWKVLSINTNVGQCSLFPHLTKKNWEDKILKPLAWKQNILHIRQVLKQVGSDTKWGHSFFFPFFQPFFCLCTVTDGLSTADMRSLWFSFLSRVVQIPPGCSRTVLHQVCGWWQASVLKQTRLNATESKIFFSKHFLFQWTHPNAC